MGPWPRRAVPVLVVWLWAARAQAAVVVIVRPAAPSPAAIETLSRLRGELLSVGLTVEVVARPALRPSDGSSSRAWLEQVAAERHADGALDIVDKGPICSPRAVATSPRSIWRG